jgi:hypothetical protein
MVHKKYFFNQKSFSLVGFRGEAHGVNLWDWLKNPLTREADVRRFLSQDYPRWLEIA